MNVDEIEPLSNRERFHVTDEKGYSIGFIYRELLELEFSFSLSLEQAMAPIYVRELKEITEILQQFNEGI